MDEAFEEMDGCRAFTLICETICRLRGEEKNIDHRMIRSLESTKKEIEALFKMTGDDEPRHQEAS